MTTSASTGPPRSVVEPLLPAEVCVVGWHGVAGFCGRGGCGGGVFCVV